MSKTIVIFRSRSARLAVAAIAAGLAAGALATRLAGGASQPEQPPGLAEPRPGALLDQLTSELRRLGPDYVARTEHVLADGSPRFSNRLLLESSPYLRQHAHNPVDWYPWSEEAFARARTEQKPVFLSVGYSTCHWCHVMERESFDNLEVAERLNRDFIAIKVDREQRPDVDDVYMTAVQLLRGSGGWPMTVILTPEAKPFFGGTYLPKAQLLDLLGRITQAWEENRERVLAAADELNAAVVKTTEHRREARAIGDEVPAGAESALLQQADRERGGFGGAPKFPREASLLFLLDRARRPFAEGRQDLLAVLENTLTRMARGGLFDQIGGGFHRYSTDAAWRVPHFEKMLYNQALLARVYASASSLLGNRELARTARQTLDYVLREMSTPEGTFYSATDADSVAPNGELEEGAFFVWTAVEIRAALAPADAELAIELFGVTEQGNFEGANVLSRSAPLERLAANAGVPLAEMATRVEAVRERLRGVRAKRPAPLRDDKVLTAWNGMMIAALAEGALFLDEPRYLRAAERTAARLWAVARRDDVAGGGRLWRSRLGERPSGDGLLEDSAYLAEGYLALDQALRSMEGAGPTLWLGRARELADGMLEQFWDERSGGFFTAHAPARSLLPARPKSPGDGAVPSGNSVALGVLVELAQRTDEPSYRRRAEGAITAFSGSLALQPAAFPYTVRGVDRLRHGAAGATEYGAAGVVRAEGRATRESTGGATWEVVLRVADGWHVNAHEPRHEDLVSTRVALSDGVQGWRVDDVGYPEAELVDLSVRAGELAVYQGAVSIRGRLVRDTTAPSGRVLSRDWAEQAVAPASARAPGLLPLSVRVQACNDAVCLQPELLELELDLP